MFLIFPIKTGFDILCKLSPVHEIPSPVFCVCVWGGGGGEILFIGLLLNLP